MKTEPSARDSGVPSQAQRSGGQTPSKRTISRLAEQAGLDASCREMRKLGLMTGAMIGAGGEPDLDALAGQVAAARDLGRAEFMRVRQGLLAERRKARAYETLTRAVAHPSGESPRAEAVRAGVVLRETDTDKDRPRQARIVTDLPQCVQALVRVGDVTAEGADALRRYADDMLAGAGLTSAPGWLVERVDGGGASAGHASAVQLDAWRRYLRARAVLTAREAGAVEAVMVKGLKIILAAEAVGVRTVKAAKKQGMAAMLLVMAAERLVVFYTGE